MDSWGEKSPIVDLIQQNLGGIIGSFEEGTFAVTSKEDWIIVDKKNYPDSYQSRKVICQKPPREGKKKRSISVSKALKSKILKSWIK